MVKITWRKGEVPKDLYVRQVYGIVFTNDGRLLLKVEDKKGNVKAGEEMEVTVIHAGLETGVFSKKYPELDIISFGANMEDIHTPMERLSISSTERSFEYLKSLLKALK